MSICIFPYIPAKRLSAQPVDIFQGSSPLMDRLSSAFLLLFLVLFHELSYNWSGFDVIPLRTWRDANIRFPEAMHNGGN